MQKLGLGLLAFGFVGLIGLIIWGITESSQELSGVPIFVWLIVGILLLGFLLLLAAAIMDRIKQSKTENLKGVEK
jgi:hypothetical protein